MACNKKDLSHFQNHIHYNDLTGQLEPDTLPNIILIVIDDLGWGELGCYGNPYNSTPNIDHLAQNGILYMEAYSTSPVCSPSRASILTGKLPWTMGIIDYFPANMDVSSIEYLPEDVETIPKYLKDKGYVCVHIGKWHLSNETFLVEKSPKNYGFHEEILNEHSNPGSGDYWYPYSHIPQYTPSAVSNEDYLTNSIRDESIQRIIELSNEPFFLHINFYAVHSKLDPINDKLKSYISDERSSNFNTMQTDGPNESWNQPNNPFLAAMLESIDDAIGDIVKALQFEQIYNNTLIILTSDNGGPMSLTDNGGLKGGKTNLFEGGIRVPLIIHYPQLETSIVSSSPVWHVDIFPTIKSFFCDSYNNEYGVSLFSALNPVYADYTRTFYWHYPTRHNKTVSRMAMCSSAIRKGDYKLIHDIDENRISLYNITKDREESLRIKQRSISIQLYNELQVNISN